MGDHSKASINDLIYKLASKIMELKERSFFNAPATIDKIEELEKITGISLPDNLKLFYLNFNGGFFANKESECNAIINDEDVGYLRWTNNYILSIEDIINSYLGNKGGLVLCDIQWQEETFNKKLLPFLSTSGQESLILDASDIANKTPILDAWHEVCYNEWDVLYSSFETFLSDYIEKEGEIETIAPAADEDKPLSKPKKVKDPKIPKGLIPKIKYWWLQFQIKSYIRLLKYESKKNSLKNNKL